MPRTQPPVVFTLGLLHLLLGGLGLLVCLYRTVTFFAGPLLAARFLTPEQQERQAAVVQILHAQAPAFAVYQVIADLALPWLLTVLLLTAGVGLLRLRPAGWRLSIAYALLSIGHKLGTAVYTLLFLLPVYQAPLHTLGIDQPLNRFGAPMADVASTAETTSILAAVAVPFLLMLYPLAVLLVMARPNVRAALRAVPAPIPADLTVQSPA